MKVCEKIHSQIVYDSKHGCPLCKLIKHNNRVHDFIESRGLQWELIEEQQRINREEAKFNQP